MFLTNIMQIDENTFQDSIFTLSLGPFTFQESQLHLMNLYNFKFLGAKRCFDVRPLFSGPPSSVMTAETAF